MQIAIQVTFQNMPVSDAIESQCWERALALETQFDGLAACHVRMTRVVRGDSNELAVHLSVSLPDAELVVDDVGTPSDSVDEQSQLICQAFEQMDKRLQQRLVQRR